MSENKWNIYRTGTGTLLIGGITAKDAAEAAAPGSVPPKKEKP